MTNQEKCNATCKDGSPCEAYPISGSDKCRMHAGKNDDSHDGNDFAAKAGAWADDFFTDFLTEGEQRRVQEATDVLGSEAGAQEVGRHVAGLALEQFRRTGDERFLRRFESICDKFGIAPSDELELSGEGGGALEVSLQREVVNDGDGD